MLCFGTHFEDRSQMLTYHQYSLKLLFAYKLPYKKSKSVKHRVISSLFRKHQPIKYRGTQTCTPPIWIGLNECDNSYARWVPSSVIIIAQSDTRNIEYVIGWLKKILLEQLLFEEGTFFRASIFFPVLSSDTCWKELVCLFCKWLLPFLTFVNCEKPCGRIPSEPFSMFRYCVCAFRTHHKNK